MVRQPRYPDRGNIYTDDNLNYLPARLRRVTSLFLGVNPSFVLGIVGANDRIDIIVDP